MGIVEQSSSDGNGAAGEMHGTEEQSAADVVARCCWDNANGKKKTLGGGLGCQEHLGVTRDLVTTSTKTL